MPKIERVCATCRHYGGESERDRRNRGSVCRRYPAEVAKRPADRCGEWADRREPR